jgi:apolipoprotein D and lipocalin family protein
MRRLTGLLSALCLAACVNAPPVKVQAFRQPGAPIYSAATLDLADLSGSWTEVAALQPRDGTCAKGGGMRIKGQAVEYWLCIGGRMVKGHGVMRPTGPGRFTLPGLAQPVWVLWVDADHRSLVLGTPNGTFATVLDRNNISLDREVAAREILDWNGYDLGFYVKI